MVPQIDWRREGDWDPTFSGRIALGCDGSWLCDMDFATDRSGRQFGQGVLDRGNIEFKISPMLDRTEAGRLAHQCPVALPEGRDWAEPPFLPGHRSARLWLTNSQCRRIVSGWRDRTEQENDRVNVPQSLMKTKRASWAVSVARKGHLGKREVPWPFYMAFALHCLW
jgi:hypothetical protein